jgi:FkbM family methyltransferase
LHAFAPFNRLKGCRYGQMLFNVNDRYIGRSLDLYGEFSEGEVELFRQIVQAGDVVLDVGANIGAHTLFFARQVGPGGCVLAFEPQRVVFQTLCANMALNSVTNARCLPYAVGAEPGQITVPVLDMLKANNFGGVGLGASGDGEAAPVITLDSLVLPSCKLVKIDVEGMELQVLRGAVRLIEKFKPVLYLENDKPEYAAALSLFVDGLGYRMYWHIPPLFNAANHAQNPDNVFEGIVSKNMLCIHRSLPVEVKGLQPVSLDAPS